MTTDVDGAHLHAGAGRPANPARRWWSLFASLLAAGLFTQAILAGAILSGVPWARNAHMALGAGVVVAALAAGLVALVTLRRVPRGARLGLILLALGLTAAAQLALGKLSAQGANLMWVHVPLGVALIAFAGQAVAGARRLGTN
jgi:hypothetical protein